MFWFLDLQVSPLSSVNLKAKESIFTSGPHASFSSTTMDNRPRQPV